MNCRALCLLGSTLLACGGSSAAAPTSYPPAGAILPPPPTPQRSPDSIELTLRRTDGTFLEIGDLRGHVAIVFVFATFDGVSQMMLRPLRAAIERRSELRVVGLAAQPSARLLVEVYEQALQPPFPVGYDPTDAVVRGESSLGTLDAIPMIYVLDRRGVIASRAVGFVEDDALEELLRQAESR